MFFSLFFNLVVCMSLLKFIESQECVSGKACIFRGKDLGWEYYTEKDRQIPKYPPLTDSWKKTDTSIFMTMASFRDKLCPVTLFNAFTKAKYPERITIGVVQQNEVDDVDCVHEYCHMMSKQTHHLNATCPYIEQIRILRVPAREAKGPTWGRAKASQLLGDEEFCMQTDSHMDMTPGWDVDMLNMWGMIENEYAILSTYVTDVHEMHSVMPGEKGIHGLHEVPHLCMVSFKGSHGLVRNWGTKCMRSMPTPKMTNIVWGAGLSFAKCHAERKVPYDPHIPHIFDGEEYSRALRFWTSGYDIYTPHRVYILHNYQGSQTDPKHGAWGANRRDPSEGTVQDSATRLGVIFHHKNSHKKFGEVAAARIIRSKYGLGDRRTMTQAIAFSGLDTVNGVTIENKCGNNLEYVPFKEHPGGPEYVPRFDEHEDPLDVPDSGSIYFDGDNPLHLQGEKDWLEKFPLRANNEPRIKQKLQLAETFDSDPKAMNGQEREKIVNNADMNASTGAKPKPEAGAKPKPEAGANAVSSLDYNESTDLLRIRRPRSNYVGVKQHAIPNPVIIDENGEIQALRSWTDVWLDSYQNDTIRSLGGVVLIACIIYVVVRQYTIYRTGRKVSIAVDHGRIPDTQSNHHHHHNYKYVRKGVKLMNKRNKMKNENDSNDREVEIDSNVGVGMGLELEQYEADSHSNSNGLLGSGLKTV